MQLSKLISNMISPTINRLHTALEKASEENMKLRAECAIKDFVLRRIFCYGWNKEEIDKYVNREVRPALTSTGEEFEKALKMACDDIMKLYERAGKTVIVRPRDYIDKAREVER
jgi:hypothetical protein